MEQLTSKTCRACGQEKLLWEFPRERRMPDGLGQRCSDCANAAQRDARRAARRGQVSALALRHREQKALRQEGRSRCSTCGEIKPLDGGFYPDRALSTGWSCECRTCTNARTAARQRRHRAAYLKQVDPGVVYDRDGGRCGLCSEPVPRDRFDMDHITPLIQGGEHSYDNVRLAHASCIRRRGRPAATEAALVAA